jgi:hypothetical protein
MEGPELVGEGAGGGVPGQFFFVVKTDYAATWYSTFLCSMPRLFNVIYIQSSHVQRFPMFNSSYVPFFLCTTPKQRRLLFKAKIFY